MAEIKHIGKCLLVESKGKKILAVGDLHIGYEEALERSGAFVGRGMFGEMISEFDLVFSKTGDVDEIVLLGDLKHDFSELTMQERRELNNLFDHLFLHCERIVIVRGNHDNYLLNISLRRGIEVRDFYVCEEVCFLHGDRDFVEIKDKKKKYWVLGHFHPAVVLREERGVKSEKYKCFLEGDFDDKKIVIVPSFFKGSEGIDFRENEMKMPWKFNLEKFRIFVVGENLEVLDFGEMKKIN
jgi:putative SbcD/Mre11-related phosphoesterase